MAPEEVSGAVSGSKAEPKGGKKGPIDFFWGTLGASPGLRGPLAHNEGSPPGRPRVAKGAGDGGRGSLGG